ncbi:MAG: crosslink repair DNA glycosylase YcaQ family protein [Thermoanaerobaculia bacterium]|nr:crosslink repair DNA glycosylase YcaQ family protein [Thermoanaerobaculia bacterium]
MRHLSLRQGRRLALARAGLLKRRWTGLPRAASGTGRRARRAAHAVIARFGYLQLDTISIAGARSHALVLLSRLDRFEPRVAERLLRPGEPLFEYWGHEVSWLPLELYPVMEFRRRDFRVHPWWGDLLGQHPRTAAALLSRIEREGPLRSVDLEGRAGSEMWSLKKAKRVALALWSAGDLAIRERRGFQRVFDLTERVIPAETRRRPLDRAEALRRLLLRSLAGHGWASTGTLTATFRLKGMAAEVRRALEELVDAGEVEPCSLEAGGRRHPGWIRPDDLDLAERLERVRPRADRGVLLSPFDPLLWDRRRVELLFGFHQVLEIYKPVPDRIYGYYCLPVLAGERLVGRVDLKANRAAGRLRVLRAIRESERPSAADGEAERTALARLAEALGLQLSRA